MPSDMDKVYIFDTTLRDGEQSPGVSLNAQEKIEIARQLERLGVDIVEAGFPFSSPGDLEAVRAVAREVRGPSIAALAHANPGAVDAAWEAIKEAAQPRIHVFLSTSDIHMAHQLRKSREEVHDLAVAMVRRAAGYTSDVEFSPMDATRSDPLFLHQLLEAVIEAGATTVNIPDTVGYTTPEEFAQLLQGIFATVPNLDRARVSVHCHNDLGLAVANSLAAVRVGARQVEVCVNGIGERAGNAALEEVVMGLRTRRDFYRADTDVDTRQIEKTSRLVSEFTGMWVQPNKAIVGANAFKHHSGIHQDGVLKERTTYEIMDPQSIGIRGSTLVLGKLSGRHALRTRLEELGYTLHDEELDRAFRAFKDLADRKKEINDRDLEALVTHERRAIEEVYRLDSVQVTTGDHIVALATVEMTEPGGAHRTEVGRGNGPVDAVYEAINKIVQLPVELDDFEVRSVTEGNDALGEVTVRLHCGGRDYMGRGTNTDIIVASARAYVTALNRALSAGPITAPL